MTQIAGSRHLRGPASDDAGMPAPASRTHLEVAAATASERLAGMANACEGFYIAVSFLAYLGAALLIFFGIWKHFSVAPGIGLAVGITVSLFPMLLLCRWAQAYAADLTMRSADEVTAPAARAEMAAPVGLYGHKS